jgi:hypothetical protein
VVWDAIGAQITQACRSARRAVRSYGFSTTFTTPSCFFWNFA